MKAVSIALSVVIAAVAAMAVAQPASESPSASSRPPRWEGPEHIWLATCGYCHGGTAGAPELRGLKLPANVIARFVRNGAPGMPVFHASEISDDELRALSHWIAAQPAPERRQ